jgi:phenylacetate-CoA ligase
MKFNPDYNTQLRIRLFDLAKGTSILKFYLRYLKMMEWEKEKLNQYRLQRLQQLMRHSYHNIDFYKETYSGNKIKPEDIRSLKDFAFLPSIDRNGMQLYYESFKRQKKKLKKVISGSSSGSTGTPIRYETDLEGYSAGMASRYALYAMSGWAPGKKNYYVWGNKYSVQQWGSLFSKLKQAVFRQKNIPSTLLTETKDLSGFISELIRFDPCSMEGYANSIHHLALAYQKTGKPKLKSLKVVFTTAENLEPLTRQEIENIFAPVSDLYGCGEVFGMAIQPIHQDKYFIFEPHVILESEKENSTDIMGEVVVTDLDNFHMPLIRYKPGDLISEITEYRQTDKFPFSGFKQLYGRSSEYLMLPDGRKLYPVTIFGGTAFRKIPSITRHKVVWDGTKLKMIFESAKSVDLNELEKIILEILKDYHLKFVIEITEKIRPDENTGKYKYFINEPVI